MGFLFLVISFSHLNPQRKFCVCVSVRVCHIYTTQIGIANSYLLSVKSDGDKCVSAGALVSGRTFLGNELRTEYCDSMVSH